MEMLNILIWNNTRILSWMKELPKLPSALMSILNQGKDFGKSNVPQLIFLNPNKKILPQKFMKEKSCVWYQSLLINKISVLFQIWRRLQLESFTTSKTDRHLLHQKVLQKISVIKTNTFDDIKKIVHFGILIHVLSWRQKKHKCLLWLLRLSDELFDVINDDSFLTL